MFAKIYDTADHGQILVKADSNDEGAPEVRFFFQPENLGVCSMAITFSDNDGGWDEQDRIFAEMTEAKAGDMVAKVKASSGI